MVLEHLDSYMQKKKKKKERKKETRPPIYTIHKNKLQMEKKLNISCDTIKVLEENIDRKISDIPHSNIFTDMSPRASDIKERINKWDFIKIKSFCMAKENISKMQRETTIWGNIFANDIADNDLISKIKNSQDSTLRRKTIQLKNRPWLVWLSGLRTGM